MKRYSKVGRRPTGAGDGFTLIEVVVGMAIVGIVFVALYSGMTMGFSAVRLARENTGATQVLTERFETLRLYNWDQINSNGFIPANFVVPLDASVTNSSQNYTGVVTISTAGVAEAYSNDLRLVTVTLTWMTGSRLASRSRQGYVARYGLQNYVY
jgi:prepilin-type N-terminal cleavage/methylation domain-containing protein